MATISTIIFTVLFIIVAILALVMYYIALVALNEMAKEEKPWGDSRNSNYRQQSSTRFSRFHVEPKK